MVLACAVWWEKAQVWVWSDNEAVVVCLNSGYSRDPHIMHLLRCLFFIKACCLKAVHIPGRDNTIADSISRDNLELLFSQIPEADPRPAPSLQALLVEQCPEWTRLFTSCFQPVSHLQHLGPTVQGSANTQSSARRRS